MVLLSLRFPPKGINLAILLFLSSPLPVTVGAASSGQFGQLLLDGQDTLLESLELFGVGVVDPLLDLPPAPVALFSALLDPPPRLLPVLHQSLKGNPPLLDLLSLQVTPVEGQKEPKGQQN